MYTHVYIHTFTVGAISGPAGDEGPISLDEETLRAAELIVEQTGLDLGKHIFDVACAAHPASNNDGSPMCSGPAEGEKTSSAPPGFSPPMGPQASPTHQESAFIMCKRVQIGNFVLYVVDLGCLNTGESALLASENAAKILIDGGLAQTIRNWRPNSRAMEARWVADYVYRLNLPCV
jgi:hypothetical protein